MSSDWSVKKNDFVMHVLRPLCRNFGLVTEVPLVMMCRQSVSWRWGYIEHCKLYNTSGSSRCIGQRHRRAFSCKCTISTRSSGSRISSSRLPRDSCPIAAGGKTSVCLSYFHFSPRGSIWSRPASSSRRRVALQSRQPVAFSVVFQQCPTA